jgi:outer membrane protein TolC
MAEVPLKAQVELSRLENQEILLEQQRITHEAHLKALLNRHPDRAILIPSAIEWPRLRQTREEVLQLAGERRPELRALRGMEEKERSRRAEAKLNLLPDFTLQYSYNQWRLQEDTWSGTVMLNLPIWFFQKNRAEIREARAAHQAAAREREAMEIHNVHEVEEAYQAVTSGWKILGKYRGTLLPASKANLETAKIAYGAGKIEFLTLLDSVRSFWELSLDYRESEARYGQAYARLERIIGGALNSKGGEDE